MRTLLSPERTETIVEEEIRVLGKGGEKQDTD